MKKVLFFASLLTFALACEEKGEKPDVKTDVTLSTPEVSGIGLYDAQIEGSLSFEGADEVMKKDFGVVWSTSPNPEPADSIKQSWDTNTPATISRSPFPIMGFARDLTLNTAYHARAYFVHEDNSVIYSPEITFTTLAGDAWHAHETFPGEFDQWPVGFAIGNTIYVGIGLVNEASVSSVNSEWWAYDLVSKEWSQKTDFPGKVSIHATGFAVGDKGYVLSGNEEEEPASFWEYDATADRWAQKTNFPGKGRANPMSFAINGKGYIGGGLSAPEDLWQFDPTDASEGVDAHGKPMGKWTQKAYFPGGDVFRPSVFVIDEKAYVYNTYTTRNDKDERVVASEFWVYNPANDTWFEKAGFPGETRQSMIAFSAGSKGYMGGGRDADFWEYHPATNEWGQKNDAPDGDAELSFSIGDRGYFFSEYNEIQEYVP